MVLSHTPKGTLEAPQGTVPFGTYTPSENIASTVYIRQEEKEMSKETSGKSKARSGTSKMGKDKTE